MPISPIVLQRRHAELGRIRLGAKRGGSGAPMKLESFRFTSPSESYIKDLAVLYGGEARSWDNGGKPEFEVFTDAKSIDVIAVKGGLSQWLETWSGGGCTHRCDGEVNTLTNEQCNPNDPAHKNAKPTTRLSLMLPELDAMGVWRMESHGWNAAAEIPAVAELAQYVGDLVPAVLHLVERRSIKDGKTSRFVVPVLDLRIGVARLREIVAEKSGMSTPELEAPAQQRPAIEAPKTSGDVDLFVPFFEQLDDVASLDAMRELWDKARAANLVGTGSQATPRALEWVEVWKAKAHTIKAPDTEPAADADGVVDAEFTEDQPPNDGADPDTVWQQILLAGAQQGLDTLDVLTDNFKQRMGGLLPDDASAAELQAYLGILTGQGAAA
jgi:hypothetical protein